MWSSDLDRRWGAGRIAPSVSRLLVFVLAIAFSAQPCQAQSPADGFAVERLYPSAPGGGWFVMDDLNIDGAWGIAIALTSGYARNPLVVTSPDGTQRLAVVDAQSFVDVGVAATYRRYRVYLDLPMPLFVAGNSGTVGPYQFSAPSVDLGSHPDTIADPRLGFDVRIFGSPGAALRLGVGAQFIIPSGERGDYLTDGTPRAMVRLLAAGDHGGFSYAGHVGVHTRSLDEASVPGSPVGNEVLFGIAAGRRFTIGSRWTAVVGPEVFGEAALRSATTTTGVEALLTMRFEQVGVNRGIRFKVGAGRGLGQHVGVPAWRLVVGAELFSRPREAEPVTTKN
jgi:hypothetical protein